MPIENSFPMNVLLHFLYNNNCAKLGLNIPSKGSHTSIHTSCAYGPEAQWVPRQSKSVKVNTCIQRIYLLEGKTSMQKDNQNEISYKAKCHGAYWLGVSAGFMGTQLSS